MQHLRPNFGIALQGFLRVFGALLLVTLNRSRLPMPRHSSRAPIHNYYSKTFTSFNKPPRSNYIHSHYISLLYFTPTRHQ
ncbi:uncharacterized protein GGS25DRAFT_450626 [Hypoxylon fragiforme]|uniref:uncharacterized protein n=1 Tax=Hypoxylon fragiforme TaxID=63214 RepID=UPI0020C627D8|nr:uncharacterized protein GGS25DRAFT_450626 [Hypoxylon fragiforme]KAI2604168.1 hypothetical protein GGS25DRAFT_450626 [Hypoxylon fragiforme]